MKYASVRVALDRDMNGVFLCIAPSSEIGGAKEIHFYRVGASFVESELLCNEMQKQLQAMMEHIRKCAYLTGWKDKASRKVKKRDWFSEYTGVLEWEERKAGL